MFLLQNPKDWVAKPWVDRASTFTGLGNILISNQTVFFFSFITLVLLD